MIERLRQLWRQGPGRGDVLGINRRNLDYVFADYHPGKFRELDDKIATKKVLTAGGVDVPRTMDLIASPADFPRLDILLDKEDAVVLKPAKGWGGRGILVMNKVAGQWTKPGGTILSNADIKVHLGDILSGIHSLDEDADAAICEELVVPHEFFAQLGPAGLSDLRIVLEDHVPVQAMCRVPTAASDGKANLHGGGVGLGVDLDTGRITGAITSDQRITHHPDTGLALNDLQLPLWQECVDLSIAASHTVDVRYLGVDLVVDRERGPLILEINARPGLAIQIANAAAQPVAPRDSASRADRATTLFNWFLLVAMVLSPLGYHWWHTRYSEVLETVVGANEVRSVVRADQDGDDDLSESTAGGQLEEITLTESNQDFRAARDAAAAGDTVQAVTLYRSVLSDSTLAPFALNNLAVLARRSGQDSLGLAYLQEAVDRFPAYHRGFYNLGLALVNSGRPEEGRAAFERTLDLKPNHAHTWSALGSLEFSAKNYQDAAVAFGKAIRYEPTAITSRLKLGLTTRLLGDYAAAQASFEELLALSPGHEGGTFWLARTLQDRNTAAGDDSNRYLIEARVLLADSDVNSPRVQSLRGVLAYEIGDLPAALSVFERLAHERYRTGFHRLALAQTALELGYWSRLQAAARDAQQHDQPQAERYLYLAALGAAMADPELGTPAPDQAPGPIPRLAAALLGADQRLVSDTLRQIELDLGTTGVAWPRWLAARDNGQDRALALDLPKGLAPHVTTGRGLKKRLEGTTTVPLSYALYLGWTQSARHGAPADAQLMQAELRRTEPNYLPILKQDFAAAKWAGTPTEALKIGAAMQALNVSEPEFLLDLAVLNQANGRPKAARRLLNALPGDFRDTPEALIVDSRLLMGAGQPDQAVSLMKTLSNRDPGNIEARFALGEARFATGKNRSAGSDLRRCLEQDPSRSDIRRVLARVLMKRRKYPAAIQEWTTVLALDPGDESSRFNYALCLQRTGDNAGALREYETILTTQPDRSSAVYNQGLALERLGRKPEAIAVYQRMLELIPNHEPSLRKLSELEGAKRQ
ncbi:MAG: sugar-transfer associated ATP-grasp domain-containing protein [Candidatus Krumholzibacteria bacterium]|nr:sugar-transfer associated ATP-grasp domain-containing protein [Candidatus Krumholzibacteria bacterium]